MNLNRKQLSLLATIFSLSIVVLVLYGIQFGGQQESHEDYVVEMIMDQEVLEEILKKEEPLEEQINADPIKSHLAFNETAKPSYGNPEPLQTLEELMEERSEMSDGDPTEDIISDTGYSESKSVSQKERRKKTIVR